MRIKKLLQLVGCASLVLPALSGVAHASGKPDKKYLESKVHMIWPGLHTRKLSRADAKQNHIEHARDARSLPGMLRYSQSFPLPIYDQRSTYDVVTDFYVADYAAIRDMFAEEGRRTSTEPWTARFAGGVSLGVNAWRPSGVGGLIVRDHVIVDGYEWGYRWIKFMKRKEGVSKEQADAYMRDVYAPALAKLPGIRRYVLGVSYIPKGADAYWGAPPAWDAVDMLWFDNLEDMMRVLGSIDYQENVQRAAEMAVIDQGKSLGFAGDYHEPVPFAPRYEGPSWEEMTAGEAAPTKRVGTPK